MGYNYPMSINYYNQNAQNFIDRTINIDMSTLADQFLEGIVDKGRILDLGCGSGRDSLYFMNKGYDVYAIDGSEALVDYAKNVLGVNVEASTYEDYETSLTFDGIWASASLLHVPEDDMVQIISKYTRMLKMNGIFFISFKKYKEHFSDEDRDFTCYEAISLREMIEGIETLEILKIIETPSAKTGHEEERWVCAFCRKRSL